MAILMTGDQQNAVRFVKRIPSPTMGGVNALLRRLNSSLSVFADRRTVFDGDVKWTVAEVSLLLLSQGSGLNHPASDNRVFDEVTS